MQSGRGDQQIFERDGNTVSCSFALDFAGTPGDFYGDGVNRNVPGELIYERLPPRPALLIIGSLYAVN